MLRAEKVLQEPNYTAIGSIATIHKSDDAPRINYEVHPKGTLTQWSTSLHRTLPSIL